MKVTIEIKDGALIFVWHDALACLRNLGKTKIRRASRVEPTADGRWTADLGPVGGEVFGPFDLRAEALQAEFKWLTAHLREVVVL